MLGASPLGASPLASSFDEDSGSHSAIIAASTRLPTALVKTLSTVQGIIIADAPGPVPTRLLTITATGILPTASMNVVVGYTTPTSAKGFLPVAVLRFGGRMQATTPMTTAALTVSTGTTLRITARGFVPTALIEGRTAPIARITAHGKVPTVLMRFGERIVARTPMTTASMSAIVGRVITIQATGFMPTLDMSAQVGARAIIAANGIMCIATPSGHITAFGFVPRAVLSFEGAETTTVTEAYVLTITKKNQQDAVLPVSHYTNFPMRSIVRRGDTVLGFGQDGAFDLTGDTDDDVAIAWQVKFGQSDEMNGQWGRGVVKTLDAAYLAGSFTGDITMTAAVDEGAEYEYTVTAPTASYDTIRFTPGRGLAGLTWEVGYKGEGPARIRRAELVHRSMQRKVKHG